MLKPKKYDWKDSNMAMFGSDLDKSVKKEAAQGEPAWAGSGKKMLSYLLLFFVDRIAVQLFYNSKVYSYSMF